MQLESYPAQVERWPRAGRHILAQFDADTIVVYQAFRPSIARFAAEHGHFEGGGFSLSRMSWIKPNFLWMMFRCGWATKVDQERVLAVRLRREAFDGLLLGAVASTPGQVAGRFADDEAWKAAVARSDVRLQWDPDHHPSGDPLDRRALQLGLRGAALRRYAREAIVAVEDVTELVVAQRAHVEQRDWSALATPREEVYPVMPEQAAVLGMG